MWRNVSQFIALVLLAAIFSGCPMAGAVGQAIPWPWNKPATQPEPKPYDYGDNVAVDPSGADMQAGGDWPDNEYTRRIPRPDFHVNSVTQAENAFNISFGETEVAQLRAYVRKLRAAGFTIDPRIEDQTSLGIVAYSYTAKDAAGYEVNIYSAGGTRGLTLKKP